MSRASTMFHIIRVAFERFIEENDINVDRDKMH
jgi:hypothetical protein